MTDILADLEQRLREAHRRDVRRGRFERRLPTRPRLRTRRLVTAAVAIAMCASVAALVVSQVDDSADEAAVNRVVPAVPSPALPPELVGRGCLGVEQPPSITTATPALAILERFELFRAGSVSRPPALGGWKGLFAGPTRIGLHANYGRLVAQQNGATYFAVPLAHLPSPRKDGSCAPSVRFDPRRHDLRPAVCLGMYDRTGMGSHCSRVVDIEHGLEIRPQIVGRASHPREVTYYGLAPDGVAEVTFEPADGQPVTVAVERNVFLATVPIRTVESIGTERIYFVSPDGAKREVGPRVYERAPSAEG